MDRHVALQSPHSWSDRFDAWGLTALERAEAQTFGRPERNTNEDCPPGAGSRGMADHLVGAARGAGAYSLPIESAGFDG
jgi:hypothetical protein